MSKRHSDEEAQILGAIFGCAAALALLGLTLHGSCRSCGWQRSALSFQG